MLTLLLFFHKKRIAYCNNEYPSMDTTIHNVGYQVSLILKSGPQSSMWHLSFLNRLKSKHHISHPSFYVLSASLSSHNLDPLS